MLQTQMVLPSDLQLNVLLCDHLLTSLPLLLTSHLQDHLLTFAALLPMLSLQHLLFTLHRHLNLLFLPKVPLPLAQLLQISWPCFKM